MKYVISLCILIISSTTSFSQSVTIKKEHLDRTIEELRTKDLWAERLHKQEKLIDSLRASVKVQGQQSKLNNMYYQSCRIEKDEWEKKASNFREMYKNERAKKRRKGWANALLIGAVGGMTYLYITK